MTEAGGASVAGALETVLATCAVGRSRVVLIEGAAGCGKSHLVDAVTEQAVAAGALVLTAVATPAGQRTPLGVLRQLVGSASVFALPRTDGDTNSDAGTKTDGDTETQSEAQAGPDEEAVRAFRAELCDLALDGPVVLCLDDLHHADPQSLSYLRHLVRHIRPAPVLIVATASPHAGAARGPVFSDELTRQPHFRRIRLGLLSPEETAQAPTARPWEWPAQVRPGRTAAELHRVTGGNPLLLRALLEEDRTASVSPPPVPSPDGPFGEAVTACVHRSGPAALAAARAVAVLADRAAEPSLSRLLHPGAGTTGLAALRACGLLDGIRFRHPSAAAAVLADTPPRTRAELHRKAALTLRAAGVPAREVADHLLAPSADGMRPPVRSEDFTMLKDTAERLLAEHGDSGQAERLLELAHDCGPDEVARTAVSVRLAQIASRRDPEAAEQRLTEALTGPRSARPGGGQVPELAQMLLAQGRFTDAAALLRDPGPTPFAPPVPAQAGDVRTDHGQYARYTGPAAPTDHPRYTLADHPRYTLPGPDGSPLDVLLDTRPTVHQALLRTTRLTDVTLAPLVLAVRGLLWSDRPERAVPASRQLLEEAEATDAPGRRAVFSALHAEALLRMGDVRGAHTHATAALDALPAHGDGTFRYGPVAVLVEACTALGLYEEAARHVQHPVTRRVLTSLDGLRYLRARGLHHLSLGQPHTALADFRRVGRLLQVWRADRPAMLPWRTDAAEALLRLGKARQARALAAEQLALPDARRPWVRGLTLRLLAMAGVPAARTALLGQSVQQLRGSGARLDTARALADLGHALYEDGSPAQAAANLRAARDLARQMGASALCEDFLPTTPPPPRVPAAPGTLTGSEHRVAVLAAQGLSNRRIAAELHLTVSTVEQHLTRVYRKLGVPGRTALPADLSTAGPAG